MATTSINSYTYGYRRVSSVQQSYIRQTAALHDAGIEDDKIFEDKLTGKTMDRPGLNALLKVARSGDVINVSSLDRLGRTTFHALETLELLEQRGITVRSLKPAEQFDGPTGKLVRDLMLVLAEWERANAAERAADARAARRGLGIDVGRKKTALAPSNVDTVRKLRANGLSAIKIAAETGMSRASVYRALATI